jgi:hypothetical protein
MTPATVESQKTESKDNPWTSITKPLTVINNAGSHQARVFYTDIHFHPKLGLEPTLGVSLIRMDSEPCDKYTSLLQYGIN